MTKTKQARRLAWRFDNQEFYQLLDKGGITDDMHLLNDKLREWEDSTCDSAPGSQFGWADNRRTAANDFVRSSVDAFSKSCGANGNLLKTRMRLAAHQNRTRMSV